MIFSDKPEERERFVVVKSTIETYCRHGSQKTFSSCVDWTLIIFQSKNRWHNKQCQGLVPYWRFKAEFSDVSMDQHYHYDNFFTVYEQSPLLSVLLTGALCDSRNFTFRFCLFIIL